MNRKSLFTFLAALAAIAAAFAAQAQSSISEDFTGTTTSSSWWFFNGACLTASTLGGSEPSVNASGAASGGQIPGCTTIATSYYNKSRGEVLVGGQTLSNSTPDPIGQGALRFTNGRPYGYDENGGVVFATPFPTGQGVSITFKTVTYRGDSRGAGNDGADGISFFLMDASQLNTGAITGVASGNGNGLGAWGGSLGYSCSNSNTPHNGLIGGYLGLGIDEFGNFLNGTANTLGTAAAATGDNTASGGGYQPGRIGLRGAGNVAWSSLNAQYPNVYKSSLSAAQQSAAVQRTCANGVLWDGVTDQAVDVNDTPVTPANQVAVADYGAIPNGYVVLPASTQIANEAAAQRSQGTPIYYQLNISQNGLLTLSYSICPPAGCGAFISVIRSQNITTANGPLPANFLFGFAGSTGGSSNIHEILCFQAEPATGAAASAGASEKQAAKVQTGVQAFFAYYNPNNGWTGRVTASSLGFDQFGNVVIAPTPNWDASCVLTGVAAGSTCSTTGVAGPTAAEGPANRKIVTWSGSAGIPFEYNSLTTAQQNALTAGDAPGAACNATTAYAANDRVNYLRGDRSCEISTLGVGLFRRRSSVLSDVMDSSPVWVGPPDAPYVSVWGDRLNPSDPLPENSATGQSYAQFIAAQQNRQQVVYAGANDGLLHGFRSGTYNATTGTFTNNDGYELLAYMPGAVVPTIHSTTDPSVDFSNAQYGHNYYVDATPGEGDLFLNGQWHSWIVGGLGPGGNAIYALDVTNPASFSESNAASLVVGEWTNATIVCTNASAPNASPCGQNLGNTYGTPQIRRLHDGNWGMIFGNGFGSVSGDAGIYVGVLNPSSGAVTFYYLSTSTGSAGNPNGIAYTTPADLDGDHMTDYVYAGDLQGNVWRFDLTSASESNWAVTPGPLFSTPRGQPVTTAVTVASGSPNPGMQQQIMVLFGTGQQVPLTNASAATYASGTQSLYGVWDWNMSGWNSLSPSVPYAGLTTVNHTLQQSDLQAQAVTVNTTTQDRDIAQNATICWAGQSGCNGANAKYGWYLNFPGTQEQIVFSPELVSQALTVNSLVPAANTPTSCTILSNTGFTYILSAMTGGAFNEVFLPPSQVTNPNVNNNQAYTDPHAIGILTDAVGTSFITENAAGTKFLVFETNQVEGNGNGSANSNLQGGSLGLNLPPNVIGHRVSWRELR